MPIIKTNTGTGNSLEIYYCALQKRIEQHAGLKQVKSKIFLVSNSTISLLLTYSLRSGQLKLQKYSTFSTEVKQSKAAKVIAIKLAKSKN